MLIEGGNAGADGAVGAAAVIDGELQQFLRLLYLLTVLDKSYTDVEFLKLLEADSVLDGSCLIGGCLIRFFCCCQFVQLFLNDLVFNLFEEQGRFAQLMSGLQDICVTKLFPLESINIQHLAKFRRAER